MNRELFLSKFRKGCKKDTDRTSFGLELEHFVINSKDRRTVDYYGESGVEVILSRLSGFYEEKEYSEGHLIALGCKDYAISLEPAAQLEISIRPCRDSDEVRQIYNDFRKKTDPVLDEFGYEFATCGYQPLSSIDDLSIIPKKRYEYMYRYFNEIGPWGARMMKGTASTQVSVDYFSEKDFTEKYTALYTLSPVIGLLFEDTPVFEGKKYEGHLLRQKIWNSLDPSRVDIRPYIRNGVFDFESYLEFVMNAPVIVKETADGEVFSDEKIRDILNETALDEEGVDHLLSMVFPMIRLKNIIEIRIADSMNIDRACIYIDMISAILDSMDKINPMVSDIIDRCPSFAVSAAEAIETDGMDAQISGVSIRSITEELLAAVNPKMKNAGEMLEAFNV